MMGDDHKIIKTDKFGSGEKPRKLSEQHRQAIDIHPTGNLESQNPQRTLRPAKLAFLVFAVLTVAAFSLTILFWNRSSYLYREIESAVAKDHEAQSNWYKNVEEAVKNDQPIPETPEFDGRIMQDLSTNYVRSFWKTIFSGLLFSLFFVASVVFGRAMITDNLHHDLKISVD